MATVRKIGAAAMRRQLLFVVAGMLAAHAVSAADYGSDWGPQIGTTVTIETQDQSGRLRVFDDLAGEQGLLLFLNRSADW